MVSLIGCSGISSGRSNTLSETTTLTSIIEETDTASVDAEEGSKLKKTKNKDTEVTDVGNLEVHFIDVGQGDCTLIISDGHSLLIDAGDNSKGTAIQSYLTKQGIEKLDYVIGTHPDEDHIGGLDVILYKFDCETVIMPDYAKGTRSYDDVIQIVKNKNYKITYPVVGETYILGSATFTIIAPNSNYGNNANDYSVGMMLQHGNNKFVFTGDAEEVSEADILKNGIDISANVFKVSHHGSKTSSTQAFLNAIDPEYAVISCGEGNGYGHPHAQTLNTLRAMDVQVFRTDEQGSIIADSDGQTITWNCSPSDTWEVGEGVKSDKYYDTLETKTDKEVSSDISEGTTYIINSNTEKFHNPSCSSVEDMAGKNKMESTLSRDKLINQGYSPCGRCKP